MAPRHRSGGRRSLPLAAGSALTRENLPAPLVYYPSRQGAFLGFARTREERPALCACGEGAIRNLFRLAGQTSEPHRLQPQDYGLFPDSVARTMIGQADAVAALDFQDGLCHRCNRVPPALRYCHEFEGPRFVQTYGWYINQCALRLGIHPSMEAYLPDLCPPEQREALEEIQALLEQARTVRAALAALMNGERREIPRAERSHWPNATKAELAPLEAIQHQLEKRRRALYRLIQNIVRAEFGHRPVGEAWVKETELYRVICRLFPGEEVLFHHRPEWLDGLELDIFLPGRALAVEFQGEQHYRPIKPWGGEAALLQLQARDAKKVRLCASAGVHLVHVAYSEPLTEAHIRDRVLGPT